MPGVSEHALRSLNYRVSRFYTQSSMVTDDLVACHRNRSTVSAIKFMAFSEIPWFHTRTVGQIHAIAS